MNMFFHKKEMFIPMYYGKFIIILSNDVHRCLEYIPDITEVYGHQSHDDDGGEFTIVLNPKNDTPITHGVIAHEVVHAALSLATIRGWDMEKIHDEPIAYLVGWMTNEVYKYLEKHDMLNLIVI